MTRLELASLARKRAKAREAISARLGLDTVDVETFARSWGIVESDVRRMIGEERRRRALAL